MIKLRHMHILPMIIINFLSEYIMNRTSNAGGQSPHTSVLFSYWRILSGYLPNSVHLSVYILIYDI